MEQSRFRSPIFWGEVVMVVMTLVGFFVKFDVTMVQGIAAGIITLATLFGFLNNPTSKSHF